MVLGSTDHQFSFITEDSLDLPGMTIDSQLNFDKQVSLICKKVNNQLNVMIRFRKLVNTSNRLTSYKAFVLPHFQYCSVVWHFCSSRNSEKLESLNKRALRVVFNDRESTYSHLLDRAAATSLYNLRVQNLLIKIYKCIHINFYPAYLKDLLTLRSTVYSLRGLIYCHCVDLLPLSMAFILLSILPVKLGTLYLRTLEWSPLWLVLNV